MKILEQYKKDNPPASLVQLLHDNVGGFEPHRGFKHLHASDLTKPGDGFCPREVVLCGLTKKKPKGQYIPTAMAVTFQTGRAMQRLLNEVWLPDQMVGNWECQSCGAQRTFSKRPSGHCGRSGIRCNWGYEEVRVRDPVSGASGGIDGLLDVGEKRLLVIEAKIIKGDDWEKLAAPLAEHTQRVRLYLKLIARNGGVLADTINTDYGIVLYMMRGHGKKQESVGTISPFKEFRVSRDDAKIRHLLSKANAVTYAREQNKIPCGVCHTSFTSRAKSCAVLSECFSGKYPHQITWLKPDGTPQHPEVEVAPDESSGD